MKNQKLLSVIITVYNMEKYLCRCINSVIAQTYTNLQIIIVDDCSTDKSGEIADYYSRLDNRIIVVHHERNLDISQTRNDGLLFATGEYIAFVDADDFLNINMYTKLISVLEEKDLDICRCSFYKTDGKYAEPNIPEKEFGNKILEGEDILFPYFFDLTCKVVWNCVYKADIVKGVEYPDRCHFGDNYTTGVYMYKAKRVMILNDILYYYWINPNSITNSGTRRLLDASICTQKLKTTLFKMGFNSIRLVKLLNMKLSYEIYNFILIEVPAYKVTAIHKELKKFVENNLMKETKEDFLKIIKDRNIKII
jgi:glycosyltransferase involved in cell wall biosynthesis